MKMSQIRNIERNNVVLSPIAHLKEDENELANKLEEANKKIKQLKLEALRKLEDDYRKAKDGEITLRKIKPLCQMDMFSNPTIAKKEFDQFVDQSSHHENYSLEDSEKIAKELKCPEFRSEFYEDWILQQIKKTRPIPSKLIKIFKLAVNSMDTSNRAQNSIISIIIKTLRFDIDYLGDSKVSSPCNYLDVINFVKSPSQDPKACQTLISELVTSLIDKVKSVISENKGDKHKTETLESYLGRATRQLNAINQPSYLSKMF